MANPEKELAEKEKKRDFVSMMLDRAQSHDEAPKPNVNNEDVKEIENITENIRRKIRGI